MVFQYLDNAHINKGTTMRMKTLTIDTPADSPLWDIRQALIDMGDNLDTDYVQGTIARNKEIDSVEDAIDCLLDLIEEPVSVIDFCQVSYMNEPIEVTSVEPTTKVVVKINGIEMVMERDDYIQLVDDMSK